MPVTRAQLMLYLMVEVGREGDLSLQLTIKYER